MSHLRFEAVAGHPLGGRLLFSESEHSFRFEPDSVVDLSDRTGNAGLTSASIGTLQLELDVGSAEVLFVWGYHPRVQWSQGPVEPGAPSAGAVRLASPSGLVRGESLDIASVGEWSTVHDPNSGWVRVQRGNLPDHEEALVATGTILGLNSGHLNSVWLQPVFVD